ncbi:hypothetical protein HHI36_020068, partial [Cryptolaemus montrouzieri]
MLSILDEPIEMKRSLGTLSYFGYILSGANILFGPWVTYEEYKNLHLKPKKK